MVIKKGLYIIIFCMLIIVKKNYGQSYFTVQIGKVVYNSSSVDADSTIKKQYAVLCNKYIDRYYPGKHLPLVYLIISSPQIDTLEYELAYDNLSGYPSSYKYYGADKGFNQPGIRIKVHANTNQSENLLKLLDYGISHLKEIKRQHDILMKQDNNNDVVNSLSLNQDKIISILKEPASSKIKATLK